MDWVQIVLLSLTIISSLIAGILGKKKKNSDNAYAKLAWDVGMAYTTIRKAAKSQNLSNEVIAKILSECSDIAEAGSEIARRLNP